MVPAATQREQQAERRRCSTPAQAIAAGVHCSELDQPCGPSPVPPSGSRRSSGSGVTGRAVSAPSVHRHVVWASSTDSARNRLPCRRCGLALGTLEHCLRSNAGNPSICSSLETQVGTPTVQRRVLGPAAGVGGRRRQRQRRPQRRQQSMHQRADNMHI